MSSETHEGCKGGAWCRHCSSLWCGEDGCSCECPPTEYDEGHASGVAEGRATERARIVAMLREEVDAFGQPGKGYRCDGCEGCARCPIAEGARDALVAVAERLEGET